MINKILSLNGYLFVDTVKAKKVCKSKDSGQIQQTAG